MFDFSQFEYILRILISGLCGLLIGLERKNRSKEAGIRTHFVVACGAAVFMIVSKYAFFDMINGQYQGLDVRLDPSRVASTIVSGIGFLGAGMIFVQRNTITGLTTAAGIWATAGVGMAIGAGMYVFGVCAALIIFLAQIILHLNLHREKNVKLTLFRVKNVSEEGYQELIEEKLKEKKIEIIEVSADKNENDDTRSYSFILDMPDTVTEDDILSLTKYPCSIKTWTKESRK